MSSDFRINVDWLEGSGDDAVERAAFAQIVIEIANQAVTELEDLFSRTVRPGIRVRLGLLARRELVASPLGTRYAESKFRLVRLAPVALSGCCWQWLRLARHFIYE